MQEGFSVEQESGKITYLGYVSCRSNGRTGKAPLVNGVAGGKTIEDMIRAGTFSSFATQLFPTVKKKLISI